MALFFTLQASEDEITQVFGVANITNLDEEEDLDEKRFTRIKLSGELYFDVKGSVREVAALLNKPQSIIYLEPEDTRFDYTRSK
ncbi:hypothetical protein [Sphingobacterium deserti]|uniref:Uncharacterized protein n=1 Tax=Sphingobacterium deserti TaxID=1229276 RepID=A0A0B8SZM7_9SPHI|nr:hypothetical protein [Sphingobacterium deserti]KGE13046.1 hypothetical protein DI53_3263 [Sphingobacterium deserti]